MSVGTRGFFLFILAVICCYHLLRGRTAKYTFLLLCSWTFYTLCSPRYLWVLLLLTIIDYYVGLRIERSQEEKVRRRWLILSITSNLGLLFSFKYTIFAYDSCSAILGIWGESLPTRTWEILLPLGISFHTFQGISYTVDVYRRQIKAVTSFLDYALFVAFFPQLAAGPIVRAVEFLPQMATPPRPTECQIAEGYHLFFRGLFKKLVIADTLDLLIVGPVFGDPSQYTLAAQRWAVLAWAVQIYCDFSGYTDLAIGTAKWFGFDLPANFNLPYLSTSMTEFWRRWHLSFSTWLRDYLYYPMGGSRGSWFRTQFNLMVLFILCGLWHGASLPWLIYGIYNGLILCLHRQYDRLLTSKPWADTIRKNPIYTMLAWIFTFGQLLMALILVRMNDWKTGWDLMKSMVGLGESAGTLEAPPLAFALIFLGLGGHIAALLQSLTSRKFHGSDSLRALATVAAIAAVVVLNPGVTKTFLYIQF